MNFDGKQILSTFVKMEEEVERYYSNFAQNAPEEIEYTKSLIDENLKEIHDFNTKLGLKDSLEIAERMEKDGILFVHQMMSMYPDIAKKEMETILKEEKKHLQLVKERLNFGPIRSLGL